MKKSSIRYLVITIIVCIAITVTLSLRKTSQDKWMSVRVGPVINAVYGLGTVTPDNVFNLVSGVSNSLKKVYVHAGQPIKKGQALVLYHDGQIIKAPFSGIITDRQKYNYETVDPQTPILTLVDTHHYHIQVSLDQSAAISVKKSMPVVINFEAQYKTPFHATVDSVYADNSNFYVRITPEQLPNNILPGMTGDVAIIIKKIPEAIQVPLKSISNNKVTYKQGVHIKTVPITTGIRNDQWVQITSDNIPVDAKVKVN
jgi:membrane fusion protein, macrolide-specific efflux system